MDIKKTSAWKNFTLYIKERDCWTCIVCGTQRKDRQMHGGHFIQAEGHTATVFNEQNVNAECEQCNIYGDHETGFIYSQKLDKKWGKGTAKRLQKLANVITPHYTKEQLKEISKTYLAKHRNLLAEKGEIISGYNAIADKPYQEE